MAKRHHSTNYHRCKGCGQPLVKERQLRVKCAEKALDQTFPTPTPGDFLGVEDGVK